MLRASLFRIFPSIKAPWIYVPHRDTVPSESCNQNDISQSRNRSSPAQSAVGESKKYVSQRYNLSAISDVTISSVSQERTVLVRIVYVVIRQWNVSEGLSC
jgi:hypothetical protein